MSKTTDIKEDLKSALGHGCCGGIETDLQLVASLSVLFGGQVVVSLSHAAIGDLLQQLFAGLLGQVLGVPRHRHALRQILRDGQALVQAELEGLVVLNGEGKYSHTQVSIANSVLGAKELDSMPVRGRNLHKSCLEFWY